MNRELDYQGARVRLKDDMLNLTDMWRAAGGDQQKQPAKWRDLPQATDFIAYIAQTLGKSENRLTLTKAGKTGGTWAHWQIGLAYAKYLSPAFHAWCNSIVRAHMEQRATGDFQHQVIERLDRIELSVIRLFDGALRRIFDGRRCRQLPPSSGRLEAISVWGGAGSVRDRAGGSSRWSAGRRDRRRQGLLRCRPHRGGASARYGLACQKGKSASSM